MRTRGNGTGCITPYMTAKNKRRWQLIGYVYQGGEIEFQKMEERKKAKKKG